MTDPSAIHAEAPAILEVRKLLDLHQKTSQQTTRAALEDGLIIAALKDQYHALEPEITWKAFVAGYMNVSYETSRRRELASEWMSEFGVSLDVLDGIDYLRLSEWRKVATEENYGAILDDLLGGLSDADMIAKWKGKEAPEPGEEEEEEEEQAKMVHVKCRVCGHEDDYEVEPVAAVTPKGL